MTTNKYDTVVVDYKTGNVDSVLKAVKKFNKTVVLSEDAKIIENANRLILPGQGSFDYGMRKLKDLNLIDLIKNFGIKQKKPILGICLGMQILANFGYENNKVTEGLGLIEGEIKLIDTSLRLPHIGWNEVMFSSNNILLNDIKNNSDFYFVHSYYFDCKSKENIIGRSMYGVEFPTIVNEKKIFGVQFHPEKSLKNGLKIINNFLNIDA